MKGEGCNENEKTSCCDSSNFSADHVCLFISLNLGVIKIAPLETLKVFFGQGTARDELVLFEFRLPRIMLSLLVGAGIAVAGAILQSVSQNDLAEPGILGINAGVRLLLCSLFTFFKGQHQISAF